MGVETGTPFPMATSITPSCFGIDCRGIKLDDGYATIITKVV